MKASPPLSAKLIIDVGHVSNFIVFREGKPFDPIATFVLLRHATDAYPDAEISDGARRRAAWLATSERR